jgi:heavy metal sensor kinase
VALRFRASLERDRGLHPLPAPEDRPALRRQLARNRPRRRLPAAQGRRALSRLPIRLRIALIFTAAIAPVLAVTGTYLFHRFGADLDGAIDNGLRSRAADVRALIRESDSGLREGRLNERNDSFAEILSPGGRVLDATTVLRGRVLLGAHERSRASRHAIFLQRKGPPALANESRLLAVPVSANGKPAIVVVGTSTDTRADALSDLLGILLLGGPIALLVAALAAYGGAGAALRPVEAMRARAAEISAEAPEARLPVPAADDEIGRLGSTLNAMLERLGEALEHERRFVADASHELRTPLSILKTELELALGEGRTHEELRAALASAAEETDRLTQISEDLLVLAQTDRGRLRVSIREISMRTVLEDVCERFALRALSVDREIEIDCAPSLRANVDRLRIEQAIGNLLDNSLRYSRGPIELRAERDGEGLTILVGDRGDGFPAGFAERAFERFSRPSATHAGAGAGLGMAIVQSIAAAHGGTATAGNRSGGGAFVRLELPCALGSERDPAAPAQAL